MLEFGDIFASSAAMSVYMIGSAVLVGVNLLFAASLCLRREADESHHARRALQLKVAGALAIAALFLLTGVGAGVSSFNSHREAAADSARPATISVDEIHRRIDLKRLPVQDVADYM